MKFIDIFINRPVLAIVLNIAIVVGGWTAIKGIGVRQFPEVSSSMVTVRTIYPGASAETMKGFVTAPIERALASVDGLDYMESTSGGAISTINLRLKLNADASKALAQVSAKVSEVRTDLPPGAEPPVINIERADSRFASAYIAFTSESLDLKQITDYIVRNVQPELLSVAGVQRADILGGRQYAMRVWLDPDRMTEFGVSSTEVWSAIEKENWLAAPGRTRSELRVVGLAANTDRKSVHEFEELVVAAREGRTVRLRDIATIELGAESTEVTALYRNKEAVFVGVWVLPTANQLTVLGDLKQRLGDIKPRFPAELEGEVVYDSSNYVKNALKEIVTTLLETVLIVGAVVFLFLGTLRASIVPLVAIPISLIGVGILMGAMGFSINLLTLLAIVLAVGLVVDDAIVVVENVQRLVASGMTPKEAALAAARQLAGPVIAMTITLAAVYAPIGMQKGLTGALFREFVFTLAGTVLISGVVALTLSPVLSAAVLRPVEKPGWIARISMRAFALTRRFYTRLLGIAIRNASSVVLVGVTVTLLIPVFYMLSWSELAPREDQDEVNVIASSPPDSSEDYSRFFGQQLGNMLGGVDGINYTYAILGPGMSFSGLVTKPHNERNATTSQMVETLFPKVAELTGMEAFPMLPAPLPGAGDYDMEVALVSSKSPEELAGLSQEIIGKLKKAGLFVYVDTDLKIDRPEATIVFDFEKMGALGVDARTVASDLSVFTGGASVNRFEMNGRSYKVLPEAMLAATGQPELLLDLPVTAPEGGLMPLANIAGLEENLIPRSLQSFQQRNSAKIMGVLFPGVTQSMALEAVEDAAKDLLPKEVVLDYAGESRQFKKESGGIIGLLALAIVLVYLVLAAQFHSFRDPFVILVGSVPLAIGGALLTIYLGATTLNIYSQVGLVTLVGLIAKNGILVVEFANELQEGGFSKLSALVRAAVTRFRPIAITTMATVLGHLPLVFVTGPGAASRNSIGVVLVSGMVIGSLLALFVVPVAYMLIAKDHSRTAGSLKSHS